jgi:transcriptional regulator with XRE-family HTH domain
MTRLQTLMHEQRATYTEVATRAHLQPRTVRMLATGETPLDRVSVGTIRRIASALSVPVAVLVEEEASYPGDDSRPRAERLSAAIERAMWPATRRAYLSPVESEARDDIADTSPDELFAGMAPIDARRG